MALFRDTFSRAFPRSANRDGIVASLPAMSRVVGYHCACLYLDEVTLDDSVRSFIDQQSESMHALSNSLLSCMLYSIKHKKGSIASIFSFPLSKPCLHFLETLLYRADIVFFPSLSHLDTNANGLVSESSPPELLCVQDEPCHGSHSAGAGI